MKIIFLAGLLACCSVAYGQAGRSIRFTTFNKDSINLHLDENYAIIEDTCSSVVRYGHLRMKDRQFFGPFRDLNKFDPSIVLAEGIYTDDGKLQGDFKMNYLDGEPLAEGRMEQGKMVGHWLIYYPAGKKRLEFEGSAAGSRILQAWDKLGKPTVMDGNGNYISDLGYLTWEGRLVDGQPDGIWRARKTEDRTGTVISSETFKNGKFVKGNGPLGSYTDVSRIILAGDNLLPITNASNLTVSSQACDPGMVLKNTVFAVYKQGTYAFTEEVRNVLVPVFAKVDLQNHPNKIFHINGAIDIRGKISDLVYVDGWEDRMANALLVALYKLPFLEPTLENGKPVKSAITFKFTIDKAMYYFSWKIDRLTNKEK